MTVPIGYVEFRTAKPSVAVVALLDSARPQLAKERGWEEVARRKRKATSRWNGSGLEHMEVAIVLGPMAGDDVGAEWDRLRAMGDVPTGQPQPPEVTVTGAIPGTTLSWVIEDVTPGDAMTRAGVLVRQFATVRLMESNPATVLVKSSSVATTHKVVKGDTLPKLAARYYGNAHLWRRIGNAQTPPIRDSRKALRPGRILRVP